MKLFNTYVIAAQTPPLAPPPIIPVASIIVSLEFLATLLTTELAVDPTKVAAAPETAPVTIPFAKFLLNFLPYDLLLKTVDIVPLTAPPTA